MILASAHATVHADVLVADHARQVVLLSMAGPKTAVKAIYAALRSNHKPCQVVRRGQDRARGRRTWRLPLQSQNAPGTLSSGRKGRQIRCKQKPVPQRDRLLRH
jgi:hypothetical protein